MMSLAVLGAVVMDRWFGEPPARFHPVVWMGAYLRWMKRQRPHGTRFAFGSGAALLLLGATLVTGTAYLLTLLLRPLPWWLELTLLACLLKPSFSLAALVRAAQEVHAALVRSDLAEARRLLGWHLVSRDTQALSPSDVAGATIESLAENLTDSVVAPLLFFALFGLPGAALYRFVNTADAVLGYRTPEFEWFGKPAARLDDLLNFFPARLAALLLCLGLAVLRFDARAAWRTVRRDAALTPSPNAGWTMAAVAGGLNVRLDKHEVYALNTAGRVPAPDDIRTSWRLIQVTSGLFVVLLINLDLLSRYVRA